MVEILFTRMGFLVIVFSFCMQQFVSSANDEKKVHVRKLCSKYDIPNLEAFSLMRVLM